MNSLRYHRTEIGRRPLASCLWLAAITCLWLGTLGCARSSRDQSPVAGQVGVPFPPLTPAAWINGDTPPSPDSLAGKVLVVEAFATWCGPCRAMAPAMVQLRQELDDRQDSATTAEVAFISLTPEPTSDIDAIRQFIADHGLSWPVGVGAESVLTALGTEGVPTTWVVGTDGRIVWRHTGWSGSGDLAELRSAIHQAQQNQQAATSVPQ